MRKPRTRRAHGVGLSSEPDLGAVLACTFDGQPVPDDFGPADTALAKQEFATACSLYNTTSPSAAARAKRGFCLSMLGHDEEAESLLTVDNVGTHPIAQAVLAWTLAGRHGRRLRGFNAAGTQEDRTRRRADVARLLESALAVERPAQIVFQAAFAINGSWSEQSQALASRAREIYPDWGWAHAIHAVRCRRDGVFDGAVLDALMRTLATTRHAEVFQEAYVYALNLCRFDDATGVVAAMETLVLADEQRGDANRAALAELRAMIHLHRARAGDARGPAAVQEALAAFAAEVTYVAGGRNPLTTTNFLLQAALEAGDSVAIVMRARTLTDRCWSLDAFDQLEDWNPIVSTKSMEGVLHFDHFGFAFPEAWRAIAEMLSEPTRARWCLLVAANAAIHQQEPAEEQIQLLRDVELAGTPTWLALGAYSSYADHAPEDYAGAGAVLAQLAERYAAWPADDERREMAKECMPLIDMQGSDDVVAMFEGALLWLQHTPSATGEVLLQWWAESVIDNGGEHVVERLASLSLARKDSAVARAALVQAREALADDPATDVATALAHYPDPQVTRVHPTELSLLEAACLIALLRASPLDHVRWTLRPLKDAGRQRFEPTRKFIGTLFDLLAKGVIAVDASTPADVFSMRDGRLSAYLDRVVWRISAHTLELQRAIRELPRSDWPDHWRGHAPMLARDLGVEEMTVYLEHLLRERSLPAPEEEELRAIFRVQLEHLATAQCYYLAYKTMREALDYQAKHRPGVKQVQTRVLNLLRGNGQRAIELGWNTRYQRVKELPASFLFEALHDVLTGWGNRAFDEPVMTLTLTERETPPTRH